ncbi:MAG: hypothetical protein IPP73_14135 [Chitinophagaceae bacterium]|nr:hypothetical protein [Chitinophagaceae bacterium]
MKQACRLTLSVCFILASFPFQAGSQTISSQKGLTTILFQLPEGSVSVRLPQDIRPGDQISGQVKLEPAGNNEKQRTRALDALLKRTLRVEDPADPEKVSQALLKKYKEEAGGIRLEGIHLPLIFSIYKSGMLEKSVSLDALQNTDSLLSSECGIPSHIMCATILPIKGGFDGDMTNTKCNVSGKPLEIIAESPRQCVINFPEDAKDKQTFSIQENIQPPCIRKISGVDMTLKPGKRTLLSGEQTTLEIRVSGLQDLSKPVTLTVTNQSTTIITMSGGEKQVVTIQPGSIGTDGIFRQQFTLTGIRRGDYSVNANLELL